MENEKILQLRQNDDWLLEPSVIPGPSAILRYSDKSDELETAAAIVTRYAKKSALVEGAAIIVADRKGTSKELTAFALEDSVLLPWLIK